MSTESSSQISPQPPQHVVIAGAGVIGTCTAYFLAKHHGIKCTMVDPTGTIAPAASGKAGGFLARDWNDGSPTEALTHRSFDVHQELADTLGAETIDYRRLTCAAISVDSRRRGRPSGKKLAGIEWAQPPEEEAASGVVGVRSLGSTNTIAQVHPKKLCERLWQEASKPVVEGGVGSELVSGKVVGAVHDEKSGKLIAAQLDNGTTIATDAILFACGPWTANILFGVKYHSAIVATDRILSQCVFFSGCGDPEVYVRPDQTAYCTGFPDDEVYVTEEPGQETVRPDRIAAIVRSVREATSGTGDSAESSSSGSLQLDQPLVTEQACYLPTTRNGLPVMGRLSSETVGGDGPCFIAAGHSCWGILLGPASGEAMANLIATGQSTNGVDLTYFDPKRSGTIRLRVVEANLKKNG